MDLTIDFECPACGKVLPRSLTGLAPGRREPCAGCGTATELTEHGLSEFRRRLLLTCASPLPGSREEAEQG